ncbi:MAG: hypothetical protein ACRDTM_15745, partial [Micromonosporaceae bacterium]
GEGWRTWLDGDTVICRCEEVPYAALSDAAAEADSVRSLKLLCRVGLGICQGRVCGRNATDLADALLADTGRPPLRDSVAMSRRPLAAPIRLGDLAAAPAPTDHMTPEENS